MQIQIQIQYSDITIVLVVVPENALQSALRYSICSAQSIQVFASCEISLPCLNGTGNPIGFPKSGTNVRGPFLGEGVFRWNVRECPSPSCIQQVVFQVG